MNSELINALISQIGNIVGIPLAAVLAVWQVKKGFTSKRNDEVNEKSFGLCCELFDLVSRNASYNKEVTDKITKMVKLQVPAGKATPAPPVGPALGQAGVNIMSFVKDFNDRTAKQAGLIIPVEITVYEDRSFTFICKTPPAAVLLKKAAGLEKASGEPNKNKVGKVTRAQVKEIAETKMPDLNANTVEAAMRLVEGTARSMGIEVTD